MIRFVSLKTPFVIVAVLILGVVGYALYYEAKISNIDLKAATEGSIAARKEFWKHTIQALGGTKAYAQFSRAVANLPPSKQHENAHVFGGALFDIAGTSGLAVCDSQFSFGCYHEFLGEAIATLGLASVDSLNQGCVDALGTQSLSCQHGIGHGIAAYLGYDKQSLDKALSLCEKLPYNDPIGGCYGGVFMEYNMQTMLGEEARTRPMRAGDPQYPCDVLPDAYAPACWFWSPQWWIDLQHQSQGRTYLDVAAVGRLCDTAGRPSLVRDCYQGLGTIVPAETDFNPVETARLCEEASSNTNHQLYCKSYAANSISVGGAGRVGDGRSVCKGLSGAVLEYCNNYADNKANLAQQLPDIGR